MANASIGGYTFDIDPSEASWTYTLNTSATDTYGGRVVQILSCRIDGMSVGGYITQRGSKDSQFKNMEEFERKIKAIMLYHEESKKPVKFRFPALDWDGDVFLTGYSDVSYDPATAAVHYTLAMTVDSGFDSIRESASSQGLDVIPDGVNWVRNEFNTPSADSWETVMSALKKVLKNAGTFAADDVKSLYEAMAEGDDEKKKKDKDEDPYDYTNSTSQTNDVSGGYMGVVRPLYGTTGALGG